MNEKKNIPYFMVEDACLAFDNPFDAITDEIESTMNESCTLKIYIAPQYEAGDYSSECRELAQAIADHAGAAELELLECVEENFYERLVWAVRTCASGMFCYGSRYMYVRVEYHGDDRGVIHPKDERKLATWWSMEQTLMQNTESDGEN